MQRILVEMKLLDYEPIDGLFGPRTRTAVEALRTYGGPVARRTTV